jgi:peptidoglycan/xylan/chitin deacetylase (PgdA/CDA1 family)/tetratricopeptide (TPR) repeat protein
MPAPAHAVVLAALLLMGCQAGSPGAAPSPSTATTAPPPADAAAIRRDLEVIVTTFREIIVLAEDENTFERDARRAADVLGRLLFHENRLRAARLGEELSREARAALAAAGPLPPRLNAFLDYLESTPADLRDADKLVFTEVIADLLEALPEATAAGPGTAALAARLREDEAALAAIRALYEKELERIFGRFETRGMAVRRESWESYLDFLRGKMRGRDVLRKHRDRVRSVLERPPALETSGVQLPLKGLVLTFDDGPHPRHTDRILAILERFKAKALFFALGENVGTLGAGGAVQATRRGAATKRILAAGHALANHSFSHPLLTSLSDREVGEQLDSTNRVLHEIAGVDVSLFRPPYGARNPRILAAVEARRMRSVLWNIDSKDWADPIPRSIANRAIGGADGEKRGILLFHDIQARTVEALPAVLETLQSRGYRFLSWNGKDFVDADPPPPTAASTRPPLYRESWAVLVGIDEYKGWPRLSYAVNDARAVRDLLVDRYRFKPENVTLLLNGEATRAAILSALGDRLADPARVQKDDRVLVFFAGHGVTRRLPSGKNLGYLVPVDAEPGSYAGQAISMTTLQDVSDSIPAKHVFFVTDACYSGLALTRGAASGAFLQEVTRRPARQVLTAGGAEEEVADNGPEGHSIFTWALMQGLGGKADLSGDGFITASELSSYVAPAVSALSRQTPAFGNLPGTAGGDFVFELNPESEFLSAESAQLDAEALRLTTELDRVRAALAEKQERNRRLRTELEAARVELGQAGGPAPRSAAWHNDRGTSLFREKRYAEALVEFEEALRLNPASALVANNLGFTHYRLGRHAEAVPWFEKTLALDPKRAIAHANLGDALAALGRTAEARRAYETFLAQQPSARYAPEVRRKLAELK